MTREEAIKLLINATYSAEWQGNEYLTTAHNMAIQALSQEPCDDAISRQAAIEEVEKWLNGVFGIKESDGGVTLFKHLRALPPVTLTQKWIPVSERLPKAGEYVGNVAKYYLVQNEYGDMQVARYKKTGWYPIHSIKSIGDEVVAWMPLPKPYEPQEGSE